MAVKGTRKTTNRKYKKKTRAKVNPKVKPTTTIEMEESISRHYGHRTHIIVPNLSWGFDGIHECDVFIIKKSGYAVEVEIKRSKSDLLADFKKKHDHSDIRIREFFYAITEEMVETCWDLIPEHAGIMVCSKRGNSSTVSKVYTTVKRKAKIRKDARKLTQEEQFKVARLGTMRIWGLKKKLIKLQEK